MIERSTTRSVPGRGDTVPILRGKTIAGDPTSTRDYYMRRNLAIVFVLDDETGASWVAAAANVASAAEAEAGQVVLVVGGQLDTRGLPAILDPDGKLRETFGLEARDLPALFITDRYGTLFVSTHGAEADSSLGPADMPRWLEFVACRCS